MALPDFAIKAAIAKVIRDSNEKLDFDNVIMTHGSPNDIDKKLVIKITDMSSVSGIGIKEGKMVEVEKVDNPDTLFLMDKNTFTSIILNKIDHRQAYYMGAIEATGENWVRDSILLGKIFDEVKKCIKRK
jgi:putative sterol carrier protein